MWSNLPSDLLFLIFSSETLSVTDVISFSSVCTSWRLAASTLKYHLQFRHQSPLLMFVGEEEPDSAQLYSFAKDKVYKIPNQPDSVIAARIFIGSAHGWLISAADENSELSLLNPITRQQIELPPVAIFKPVRCLNFFSDKKFAGYKYGLGPVGCENRYLVPYTAENLRYALYDKATISSSPISGDYVVALLLRDPRRLAFARAGDKRWTTMSKNPNIRNDIVFLDDGKLYTTSWCGEVEVWDFNQNKFSLIEPQLVFRKPRGARQIFSLFYLVRTPWGEILLVKRHRNNEYGFGSGDFGKGTISVDIWRIEIGTGEKLTKLESLGDYAIFLGGNISTCVSSKDNPELRGNCVYLVDEYIKALPRSVCVFSLEDGSIEGILPNNSKVDWSTPIWIMPSLA